MTTPVTHSAANFDFMFIMKNVRDAGTIRLAAAAAAPRVFSFRFFSAPFSPVTFRALRGFPHNSPLAAVAAVEHRKESPVAFIIRGVVQNSKALRSHWNAVTHVGERFYAAVIRIGRYSAMKNADFKLGRPLAADVKRFASLCHGTHCNDTQVTRTQ